MRNIFFIHTMKTAGTSFRFILEKTLGNRMYPTTDELQRNNNGWYLDNHQMLMAINDRTLDIRRRELVCGHYPYVMGYKIFDAPFFATFLRDPVSRTISMMAHRKRMSPAFRSMGVLELLKASSFVASQIENYQTKVFAIDSAGKMASINAPYRIDRAGFQRAKARVLSLGFIGITEAFESSVNLFAEKTGIKVAVPPPRLNVGDEMQVSDEEVKLIRPLVAYDVELYEIARERFLSDIRKH